MALSIPIRSLESLANKYIEGYPGKGNGVKHIGNWSYNNLTPAHVEYSIRDTVVSRQLFLALSGINQVFRYPNNRNSLLSITQYIKSPDTHVVHEVDTYIMNNNTKYGYIFDILKFIAIYICDKPKNINIHKHSKYLYNSYSKWRTMYSEQLRMTKICEALDYIKANYILPMDRSREVFIVPANQITCPPASAYNILELLNHSRPLNATHLIDDANFWKHFYEGRDSEILRLCEILNR